MITNAVATTVTVVDPEVFILDEAEQVVVGAAGISDDGGSRYVLEGHASVTAWLTVGTESLDPSLGYAVPAGRWRCVIRLGVTGGEVWTNSLPLLITSAAGSRG
ncbi:MAG: hypothetical protein U0R78_18450 [Nocardioidaceae bacterium]